MESIITDVDQLHKQAEHVSINEAKDIVDKLISSIPESAAGLAASQIGICKRAFLANFSIGQFIFINPEITFLSSEQIPSTEGCLSLPDKYCVSRFTRAKLQGDAFKKDQYLGIMILDLYGLDAIIAQHEMDHLNGVLISDKPKTKTTKEKFQERQILRNQKVSLNRNAKKELQSKNFIKKTTSKKLSKQQIEKNKKRKYKERKRDRKKLTSIELNKFITESTPLNSTDSLMPEREQELSS